MLAAFFITISQGVFVRTRSGFCSVLPAVVRVDAGLLLRTLARVECWLYFLSLLATVRGGTSFLCPTATKKRSKENAFQQSILSVPSVHATAFGSRVERCSQNHGHLKPSFSRILTSPRFATSALGQDQCALRLVRPHLARGLPKLSAAYQFQAPLFAPGTGRSTIFWCANAKRISRYARLSLKLCPRITQPADT